jgi:hypothetical protein
MPGDGEVRVAGHQELEVVVPRPGLQLLDGIGADGDEDDVLAVVEDLRVLITVRVHLDRSAACPCPEEEGEDHGLAGVVAEADCSASTP